jgi:AcrR family transcriptional regulator
MQQDGGVPAPATPARGRTRLSRADRRRQLLDVAAELVAADGVAALTLDRLAAEAGVAAGLPYAYFPSVDALLIELFDEVVGAIDDEIDELVAQRPDFAVLVRESLRIWMAALRRRRPLLLGLLGGRSNPALGAHLDRRDRRSRRTWLRVATDDLGLPPVQADVLAAVLTDSAPAVLALATSRRRDGDEVVETFVGLVEAAAAGLPSAQRTGSVR